MSKNKKKKALQETNQLSRLPRSAFNLKLVFTCSVDPPYNKTLYNEDLEIRSNKEVSMTVNLGDSKLLKEHPPLTFESEMTGSPKI